MQKVCYLNFLNCELGNIKPTTYFKDGLCFVVVGQVKYLINLQVKKNWSHQLQHGKVKLKL